MTCATCGASRVRPGQTCYGCGAWDTATDTLTWSQKRKLWDANRRCRDCGCSLSTRDLSEHGGHVWVSCRAKTERLQDVKPGSRETVRARDAARHRRKAVIAAREHWGAAENEVRRPEGWLNRADAVTRKAAPKRLLAATARIRRQTRQDLDSVDIRGIGAARRTVTVYRLPSLTLPTRDVKQQQASRRLAWAWLTPPGAPLTDKQNHKTLWLSGMVRSLTLAALAERAL